MTIRTVLTAAALGAALAGAAGCSFVLVQGPPRGHEQLASVPCTRSNVLPVVDALFTVTSISVGAQLLASGNSGWTAAYSVVGGGLLAEGLVWGASSLVGFTRTSHCRAAQREAAARAESGAAAPKQP